MTDDTVLNPDKTPLFGLDELEAGEVMPQQGDVSPASDLSAAEPPRAPGTPSIVLHDKLSGAHLVTDKFPVEIGNGRRFDMALRGPGPEGLYACIDRDDSGLVIECRHEQVFMAVDMVETARYPLTEPVSIQLGDHVLSVGFSDQSPARPARKRPKWALIAILLVLVIGVFTVWLLLAADEAESRVTVVAPNDPQHEEADAFAPVVIASSVPDPTPSREASVRETVAGKEKNPSGEEVNAVPQPAPAPPFIYRLKDPSVNEGPQVAKVAEPPLPPKPARPRPVAKPVPVPAPVPDPDPSSEQRERSRLRLGNALLRAAKDQVELGNVSQAYSIYHRAAELGVENAEGRQYMETQDRMAARLYRFGYRLRYADPATAGLYWTQVMDKVPKQSQWHRKARLALNESTGVGE